MVLGPLIYILYVNDCMNVLDRCKITMYADDCVLYYSANNWNTARNVLQERSI